MSHVVPQEFRRFIEGEVADGAFLSVADAYQEALRLLQERKKRLESLRAELQIGRDQLDRGEAIRVEEEELRGFFDDIQTRGRQRYEASKGGK